MSERLSEVRGVGWLQMNGVQCEDGLVMSVYQECGHVYSEWRVRWLLYCTGGKEKKMTRDWCFIQCSPSPPFPSPISLHLQLRHT